VDCWWGTEMAKLSQGTVRANVTELEVEPLTGDLSSELKMAILRAHLSTESPLDS